MRKIYLSQVNNQYANNVFLPYSVGLLQAYVQKDPLIKENYEFKELLFLREDVNKVAERWKDADVIGISCYIWNYEYSVALAHAIRRKNLSCWIILGGPHIPNDSSKFDKWNDIDFLVHGEGEETFKELLEWTLMEEERTPIDQIKGISYQTTKGVHKTPDRPRSVDLDKIPSPYLTGVFDNFPFDQYEFHPSQETHRGCPFQCTFCDWGSNLMSKVKRFSDERIISEFEWMGRHKLDLLYNCDANWGMFERDVGLAQRLVAVKDQYGYPRKFRAAYAKNSGERVYTISKILNDSGMSKGVTLSFQSMDEHTLDVVKRKNIGIEVFRGLMERYNREGIPTYTELIVGLPGETYKSFSQGLNTLVEAGQHSSLQVYICECLPNSEMSQPEYRKKQGIQTVRTPVLFFHGTPTVDPHQEYYELVTATKDLPHEDWLKCLRLAWTFQTFHCLGLTQALAVYWHHRIGYKYDTFYKGLLNFADCHGDTLIGEVTREVTDLFRGIPEGRCWGIVDKRFGNIMWPPEEGAFLKISADSERFYTELLALFPDNEVVKYQQMVAKTFRGPKEVETDVNLAGFFKLAYEGKNKEANELIEKQDGHYYTVDRKDYESMEEYAKDVVWYGRKGGSFLYPVEVKI